MAVNTKLVEGRRRLRFANYDEMLADARAVAAAPHRQLGNWTFGQICEHLAIAMNSSVDGPAFRPPWLVRLIGPFFKRRILARGMSPGFQLPKYANALLPPPVGTEQGLAKLEAAVTRVAREPVRQPHAVFGRMTRQQWDELLLRHAEMHLSFVLPGAPAGSA